jgi:hypothetical protein
MQWDADKAMVQQLIAISVPDTVFNRIKMGATAKDVWDSLKKLYEGCTMLIMIDLGRQLQTTHCSEEESVQEHFEKRADMCEQLAAMGKMVNDDKFALILIGSLPMLYALTLSGILAAAEISATTPTVATVTKLAINKYDRRTLGNDKSQDQAINEYDRHTLGNDKSQDQAYTTDAQKKGKKCDIECFNCRKKGHVRADCWAKGGGKEGQGLRKKHSGSKEGSKKADTAAGAEQAGEKSGKDKDEEIEAWAVVEEEEEEEQSPQIPAMVADEAGGGEMELYDSGASHHMSLFCEQFTMYRDIPARPITAANNHIFYIISAGDLEINVPNRAMLSKVLLCDTLYALDLGLTVVLISRIVKAGCTMQFEDGTCKILRNGCTISNVPASANGLFKVKHALATAESLKHVDILTLHHRLGHISLNAICTLICNKNVSSIHLIDDHPSFACNS